jgi:hypothetical protein
VAGKSKYTPQQKADALNIVIAQGLLEAAKQTGIAQRTLRNWMNEANVPIVPKQVLRAAEEIADQVIAARTGQVPTSVEVTDAVLTLEAKTKLKRAMIREDLLERIHTMLARMEEAHLEFFPVRDDVLSRTYPKAPAAAVQKYAQAFALLFKEYRLEAGEATDRPAATTWSLDVVTGDHERDMLKRAIEVVLGSDVMVDKS